MTAASPLKLALLAAVLLASACGPADRRGQAGGESTHQAAALKRITAAMFADPKVLHSALAASQTGLGYLYDLVNSGMTIVDNRGFRRAQLAEDVPSLENGLWRLLPDGRMETTWRIRAGAQWHDGEPLTSRDLQFTTRVERDRELPEFRSALNDSVEAVEALDPHQLLVRWKEPHIWADRMYPKILAAHLLEQSYLDSKGAFRELLYWSDEFVGLGPFKVREWTRGSHILLEANDQYVLGRPKIDLMEVRFILDEQTFIGNLLGGALDVSLGTNLNIEQALEIKNQWAGGRVELEDSSWIALYPQFLNPNPAVVADVRFRRALLHGIDRQAMVDTIQGGLVQVAHSWVSPNSPEYADTVSAAARYDYDPRRATDIIENIGYVRSADGVFKDRLGQALALELRVTATPAIHPRAFFPVVDYWQRLGLVIDPVVIPTQRIPDVEYRTQHPTFELIRFAHGPDAMDRLRGSAAPVAANNYRGTNRSRYIEPAFDALVDRYFTTIPWPERIQVLREVVHQISDQLIIMGLFYAARAYFIGNRMNHVYGANLVWNAHEWDIG